MKPKQELSKIQIIFLVICGNIGIVSSHYNLIVGFAGRGLWLALFAGAIAIMPLAWWIIYICKKHSDQNIIDLIYNTNKYIGVIIIILYISLSMIICIFILSFFSTMVQTFLLTSTPVWVIKLIFIFVSTLIVSTGIIAMGRFVVITFTFAVTFYLSGQLIGINLIKVEHIFPLIDVSLIDFINGIYLSVAGNIEVLLLLMVLTSSIYLPSLKYRTITAGFLIYSFIILMSGFLIISIMGKEEAILSAFAGVSVAQSIEVGEFIQGLGVFVIVAFILLAFIKIPIYLYGILKAGEKILGAKSRHIVLWCTFAVIAALSFLNKSYTDLYNYIIVLLKYLIVPYVLLTLIVATICAFFYNRKADRTK